MNAKFAVIDRQTLIVGFAAPESSAPTVWETFKKRLFTALAAEKSAAKLYIDRERKRRAATPEIAAEGEQACRDLLSAADQQAIEAARELLTGLRREHEQRRQALLDGLTLPTAAALQELAAVCRAVEETVDRETMHPGNTGGAPFPDVVPLASQLLREFIQTQLPTLPTPSAA